MQSISDIKNRIRTIKETSQITKAMELISVAKRRKAFSKYTNNHSYFLKVRATIKDILSHCGGDISHPYLGKRDGNRIAFIVIASDKGMAGDYNQKVLKLADKEISNADEKYIFTIGQMAREYFVRKGIMPDVEFLHCAQNPSLDDARKITEDIVSMYDNDLLDEVKIIFSSMKSASQNQPEMIHLLPLLKEDFENVDIGDDGDYKTELEFEPHYKPVFDLLVPQYILGIVYSCLTESIYCEHSARMVTMKNATDNAKELLDKLQLEFNRARQEAITTEIAEVSASSLM